MARRRRRSSASKFIVGIVIFASAAGIVTAVKKSRASKEAQGVGAAQVAGEGGNKKVLAATPVANTVGGSATNAGGIPARVAVEAVKQPEMGLKPLLQVSETPTSGVQGGAGVNKTPATVAQRPLIASNLPQGAAGGESASAPTAVAPGTALGRAPQAGPLNGAGEAGQAAPATAAVPAAQAVAVAQERYERGDFLGARGALNDHFVNGTLSAEDQAAARELLVQVNEHVVFGPKIFAGDVTTYGYTVRSGELLQTIARNNAVTWELLCRVNGMSDPRKLRAGQTLKVVRGPFYAVVHKKAFVMDLFLGSPGEAGAVFVTSFRVGLGKDDSTPTGKWVVEPNKKIKNPVYYSPRGEGVFAADDPKNPLGEFWIALTGVEGEAVGKLSYGIHGTIEPETIGTQASLGCIRLRDGEIDRVYEMLVDGKSAVVVKE